MAVNELQRPGWNVQVTKASVAAGDAVAYGNLTGVSEAGTQTVDGVANQCVINREPRLWNLKVNGVDGSGSQAVNSGDLIYLVDGDTIKLSKKATGVLFGVAIGPANATVAPAAGTQLIAGGQNAFISVAKRAD